MRWHTPNTEVKRVIVWALTQFPNGKWSWLARSRNGRPLVVCTESFGSRELAARGAMTFGAPAALLAHLRVTALHDGGTLVLNWSDNQ